MIEKYRVSAIPAITHRLPDKKEMKNVEKVIDLFLIISHTHWIYWKFCSWPQSVRFLQTDWKDVFAAYPINYISFEGYS